MHHNWKSDRGDRVTTNSVSTICEYDDQRTQLSESKCLNKDRRILVMELFFKEYKEVL